MEPCAFQPKLKKQRNPPRENFLHFRKPKRRKSSLKKFLVSYDVFAIFTSAEHMEIFSEAKNETHI